MRDANIYTQFIPTLFRNKEKTTEFIRWHLTIWWLRGDSNPRHTGREVIFYCLLILIILGIESGFSLNWLFIPYYFFLLF